MTRWTNILVVAVAAIVAGCGAGSEAKPAPDLSRQDSLRVAKAEAVISHYCVVKTDPEPGVDEIGDYGEALDELYPAVNDLIALYRARPTARYTLDDGSRTLRQVVSDNAGALEQCEAGDQARELDRALDAGA